MLRSEVNLLRLVTTSAPLFSLLGCPEGVLEKLNLPVALKVELERIGKLPFEQPQFFHALSDANSTDSRYQIKVRSIDSAVICE